MEIYKKYFDFDEYDIKARIVPVYIIFLPTLIFIFHATQADLRIPTSFLSSFLFLVIIFFASDTVRDIGKFLENRYFGNGRRFPTTELLLHKNSTFSPRKKEMIYSKIMKEYSIKLMSEKEEIGNESDARKRIHEAVQLMIQHTRKSSILQQRNIRYGGARNLIAVSLLGFLSSLIYGIYFFITNNFILGMFEALLSVFFLGLWTYKNEILKFLGNQYAEQLFLEFLK